MGNAKWGNRPYELKKSRNEADPFTCPTCWLLRGNEVRLELVGKRQPVEDRPCECPACHRKWESVRFFLYFWCPMWVPVIESELHAASGVDERNELSFEEAEEREWRRMQEVKQAVEAGTWSPSVPNDLSMPTEKEMAHYDPALHTPSWARKGVAGEMD